MEDFLTKKNIIIGILIILGIMFLLNSFVIVSSTQRGIVITFGSIGEKELKGGLHFKLPFIQSIEKISLQPKQIKYDIDVGASGAITKDNQTVGATTVLFYKNKPDFVVSLFRDFSEEKMKEILTNKLKESIKAVVGTYDIFELPLCQEEVRNKTLVMIREKIIIYPIEVTELNITNYDWSDDFDKQIQETMKKAQEVKQKEQELLITQLESQKRVKEAESSKMATITQAEGEKESAKLKADAKALEGEGIRKYNQSIAVNWEIELQKMRLEIEKIKAEKWNGQYVPNNNYTPIPFSQGHLQGN